VDVYFLTIFIYEAKYVLDLLKRFKVDGCNPSDTPYHLGVKLTKECDSSKVVATFYRQLVYCF
jgi:hypothetical protein